MTNAHVAPFALPPFCIQRWNRFILPTKAPDIRYSVPESWLGHKHARIEIRLFGVGGKRRKKTMDLDTRNDYRVRNFRNWVDKAYEEREYKWWLVPAEDVVLLYLRETHLGGKKNAGEASLVVSAVAWWGEALMGTRMGWRNHWHAVNVAVGLECTTQPARPKRQALPIDQSKIRILAEYCEHQRQTIFEGQRLQIPGPNSNCQPNWYSRTRVPFEWILRTTILGMTGFEAALRGGEYMSGSNNMPYLRNHLDGGLETPALMLKDLSTVNENFMGADLRDQKGGKSRPTGVAWDRHGIARQYDVAALIAEWNGFETVEEMVAAARNPENDRVPLVGYYKFSRLIDGSITWKSKGTQKKRRERYNTIASFNKDLKVLMERAISWKNNGHLSQEEETYCSKLTSHGLRRGYVHTRYQHHILKATDFRMDGLLTRKLRWKSEDLAELYGCNSTNEMMAIFSRID